MRPMTHRKPGPGPRFYVELAVAQDVSDRDEEEWWAIPGRSRLRAIELAQGVEA